MRVTNAGKEEGGVVLKEEDEEEGEEDKEDDMPLDGRGVLQCPREASLHMASLVTIPINTTCSRTERRRMRRRRATW